MNDLIERLEKATGPDREIDLAIYRAEFPHPAVGLPKRNQDEYDRARGPRYTSSIDAALTLVPEGCKWEASSYPKNGAAWVGPFKAPVQQFTVAATPAIALCIAALKARLFIPNESKADHDD